MGRPLPSLVKRTLACALLAAALPTRAGAQVDWTKYEARSIELLQQYLRLDTSNPPGNEQPAAEFFCALFAHEGIECQVFEVAPGRANVYARLRGDGSKRPIILLNHTDVVTANPKNWSVPPFSGEIRGGALYGRGAQDMKAEGMLQALVLVALKHEGVALARDVIFLGVADEEVSGLGSGWMLGHKRDLLSGAEYLINEGGENTGDGGVPFWGVDVAEKIPFWLRLTAHGKAGHGSVPSRDAATHRLAHALARVVDYETPLTVLPEVQRELCDEAPLRFPQEVNRFCHLEASLRDPAFRRRLAADTEWNYLLRNTISLTVMRGAPQTNVIPAEAVAELDVRLLPGEDPQKFLAELRRIIADPGITVEPIAPVRAPSSSPVDTELWRVFEQVVARHFPGTRVTPRLLASSTESPLYRQLGIIAYGFCPFVSSPAEAGTPHGDDERISIESYQRGLGALFEVVAGIAGRH
ncbi:MAG TPA: M20/M25/M40 family metallo-hydrolase [Candidatus Acidoferrales bacterium]|nr:M20/M25/M40 family metallo-hydrolase [Candidatus Acidoferrales bacterium]